jgi:O-antigen/teichoic acid export membrane protein
MSRSIAKNTFLLVAFQFFTKALSLVWVFYLARGLGVEGYGLWANALAASGILSTLQDLGTFSVLVKEVSQKPEQTRRHYGTALTLYPFFCICILPLLALLGWGLGYPLTKTGLLLLAGLSLVALSVGYSSQMVLQGHEDFRTYVTGSMAGTLVYFACGAAALTLGGGAVGALIALVIGNSCTSAVLFFRTSRRYGRPEWRWNPTGWAPLIRLGLPLMASALVYELMVRSDRILIEKFFGPASVGLFQAAFFLANLPRELFLNPLINAVYPRLASASVRDSVLLSSLLERLSVAVLVLTLFLSVCGTFLAVPAVRLLYGQDYGAAGEILSILVWICPLMFISILWNCLFVIEDRTGTFMMLRVLTFLLGFGLNILLLPRYGVVAAAWAQVAAQVFFTGLVFAGLRGRHSPTFLSRVPRILAAAGGLGGLLFWVERSESFSPQKFVAVGLAAPLFYALFVRVFRVFTAEETEWLRVQGSALWSSIRGLGADRSPGN